ncbi:primase-helicase zinc-binding domain-containing protein [Rosenbergiella australiborealis]|uniref:primase-helicase zinc-binding domain-containing protein n=1 Tax=Rosenbergiella australiborealis TaxID=1544696 RepID=UPI001F4D962C|nr:primase-helicase zinc-binding domain-containing protein [Rosenbergiella australiborealis]
MNNFVSETASAARGSWAQVFPALGLNLIKNRHAECPLCGGKDRFRFDDEGERGTWICNQCGAGDGLELASKYLSVNITEAARRVREVIGQCEADPTTTMPTPTQDKAQLQAQAATIAQEIVSSAIETENNAYLTRKGWQSVVSLTLSKAQKIALTHYRRGDLIIPLHNMNGELVNVQLINAEGEKRTLKGGQVKAASHILGADKPAKRIWLAEGYATALTVHKLTGEQVWIAFSSANFLSLASCIKEKHPTLPLIIAADRDLNEVGQQKAQKVADEFNAILALPPLFGDWNDAYIESSAEKTKQALRQAILTQKQSPFEVMSSSEFTAMSVDAKATAIAEHYHNNLAIDESGEILSRYEGGAWKVITGNQFERDVVQLYQAIGASFSAGKISALISTLKLILPQQKAPSRQLIGFLNGVLDTQSGTFKPHQRQNWLRTVNNVAYTTPLPEESIETNAPHFWKWLNFAAANNTVKRDVILAALFMVLANRYDWQLFLEITGPGGTGKSLLSEIATMLAGKDNTFSAKIENLELSRERAPIVGRSLILLPDQEKWSGDGAGIKAITGGDAVSVDPKYKDAYSAHIPAVIIASNNNPMRFTDRSGGISRRRVILHFAQIIPARERDHQLADKIREELPIIVRQLMKRFADPNQAKTLLQNHQNSPEAIGIKREADPMADFCGYLFSTPEATGLYMGNASIRPMQPRRYLYHAYLTFMEANNFRNPLSMKSFSQALESILREYGFKYVSRRTKNGIQTNLDLKEESNGDWLPKCDEPML